MFGIHAHFGGGLSVFQDRCSSRDWKDWKERKFGGVTGLELPMIQGIWLFYTPAALYLRCPSLAVASS